MLLPSKNNKELVSVIVTSYNHAEYLVQRMESLLKQTYDALEIIVIDDCSRDDSAHVLDTYRQYPHIHIVVLDKNVGYANACNLGVKMSRGEYIMFAECDDFNEPSHIAVLMNALADNKNIAVAYCKSNMVDENGATFGDDFQYREKSFQIRCANDTLIPGQDMQRYLLISCVIPNMSAALIRKSSYQLAGGLSATYRACADWDLWCRIAQQGDFYYVTVRLNNFRNHRTTVRSMFGIKLQVSEMFDLLYEALSHTQLTFLEKLKFRLNMGFIWANYITYRPLNWISSFPAILIKSMQYEKLSVAYLFFGFIKKVYSIARRSAAKIFPRSLHSTRAERS